MNESEDQLINRISWNLDRQLAWAGLFLASLLGIAQFISIIHTKQLWKEIIINKTDLDLKLFFYLLSKPDTLFYLLLIISLLFSSNQIIKTIIDIAYREMKLNNYGWSFEPENWSLPMKILIKSPVNSVKIEKREWIVYIFHISIIFGSEWFLIDVLEVPCIYLLILCFFSIVIYFFSIKIIFPCTRGILKREHAKMSNDDSKGQYIIKVASTIEEFTVLLESGFEYISDYEGKKVLRKRK